MNQWRQFFYVSSRREKYGLLFFFLMIVVGGGIVGIKFYFNHTQIGPAKGGTLTIAMVGASPHFLNPVLSPINTTDRDLTPVFFSSLMKYDNLGNLTPDLTENYTIGDNGKTYDLTIRKNIKWQDEKPLNIDDVIFTLQTIQNSDYSGKSPLRVLWQGAEFEKIDDYTIRFKLKAPYAPFLHTLTFGILPKHLWQNFSPSQFSLTELNQKPVGSGPYEFTKLVKDSNGNIVRLETKAFADYFLGQPNISQIVFKFYNSEEEAISAYKKDEVNAINSISEKAKQELQLKYPDLTIYSIVLPRYFAVFFNQSQNPALADKNIRQAIAFATDKNQILKEVYRGDSEIVDSPILRGMTGYSDQVKKYNFDPDKAKEILNSSGWKDENSDGILEKNNQKLEITIVANDWPEITQTAQLLKQQWLNVGIGVNLDIKDTNRIKIENIIPRQYQALLFGEILGPEPDLFSFWHSSQKKDPGLNLSLYENPDADKLIMEARQELDVNVRSQKYQQFDDLIAEDLPAIFLYNPDYFFAASKDIQGIMFKNINNISSYLNQINNWFINTERNWK